MKKIVVIGSMNMDLITQTDRVPAMGETLNGFNFKTACGGKGGNQAYAAARMGGNVTMLGCVGDDVFGKELVENLKVPQICCDDIAICKDTASGIATITVCQGDNSIIVIPGANDLVTTDYIDNHLDVLKEADFIILQLEIPIPTVCYIITYAKEHNIPVILNAAPPKALDPEILAKLSYIIVNETECEFYTGINIQTVEDAKMGLTKLLELGITTAIVTLGSQGAVYNCGSDIYHEPARKVKAVDSTAAGDTFTAAIVISLLEGKTMPEAIFFATKASSIVVTRMGAQTSIPTREEIDTLN